MKRRYFLSLSTLALAGAAGRGYGMQTLTSAEENVASALKTYLKRLDAFFLPNTDLPSCLQERVSAAGKGYLAIGYQPFSNGVYVFSDHMVAHAVQLNNSRLGVLDVGLMFFCELPSGEWKKFATLSGFQIRAIVDSMPKQGTPLKCSDLRQNWLPVYRKSTAIVPGTYAVASGSLTLSTILAGNDAVTKITLTSPDSFSGSMVCDYQHEVAARFNV